MGILSGLVDAFNPSGKSVSGFAANLIQDVPEMTRGLAQLPGIVAQGGLGQLPAAIGEDFALRYGLRGADKAAEQLYENPLSYGMDALIGVGGLAAGRAAVKPGLNALSDLRQVRQAPLAFHGTAAPEQVKVLDTEGRLIVPETGLHFGTEQAARDRLDAYLTPPNSRIVPRRIVGEQYRPPEGHFDAVPGPQGVATSDTRANYLASRLGVDPGAEMNRSLTEQLLASSGVPLAEGQQGLDALRQVGKTVVPYYNQVEDGGSLSYLVSDESALRRDPILEIGRAIQNRSFHQAIDALKAFNRERGAARRMPSNERGSIQSRGGYIKDLYHRADQAEAQGDFDGAVELRDEADRAKATLRQRMGSENMLTDYEARDESGPVTSYQVDPEELRARGLDALRNERGAVQMFKQKSTAKRDALRASGGGDGDDWWIGDGDDSPTGELEDIGPMSKRRIGTPEAADPMNPPSLMEMLNWWTSDEIAAFTERVIEARRNKEITQLTQDTDPRGRALDRPRRRIQEVKRRKTASGRADDFLAELAVALGEREPGRVGPDMTPGSAGGKDAYAGYSEADVQRELDAELLSRLPGFDPAPGAPYTESDIRAIANRAAEELGYQSWESMEAIVGADAPEAEAVARIREWMDNQLAIRANYDERGSQRIQHLPMLEGRDQALQHRRTMFQDEPSDVNDSEIGENVVLAGDGMARSEAAITELDIDPQTGRLTSREPELRDLTRRSGVPGGTPSQIATRNAASQWVLAWHAPTNRFSLQALAENFGDSRWDDLRETELFTGRTPPVLAETRQRLVDLRPRRYFTAEDVWAAIDQADNHARVRVEAQMDADLRQRADRLEIDAQAQAAREDPSLVPMPLPTGEPAIDAFQGLVDQSLRNPNLVSVYEVGSLEFYDDLARHRQGIVTGSIYRHRPDGRRLPLYANTSTIYADRGSWRTDHPDPDTALFDPDGDYVGGENPDTGEPLFDEDGDYIGPVGDAGEQLYDEDGDYIGPMSYYDEPMYDGYGALRVAAGVYDREGNRVYDYDGEYMGGVDSNGDHLYDEVGDYVGPVTDGGQPMYEFGGVVTPAGALEELMNHGGYDSRSDGVDSSIELWETSDGQWWIYESDSYSGPEQVGSYDQGLQYLDDWEEQNIPYGYDEQTGEAREYPNFEYIQDRDPEVLDRMYEALWDHDMGRMMTYDELPPRAREEIEAYADEDDSAIERGIGQEIHDGNWDPRRFETDLALAYEAVRRGMVPAPRGVAPNQLDIFGEAPAHQGLQPHRFVPRPVPPQHSPQPVQPGLTQLPLDELGVNPEVALRLEDDYGTRHDWDASQYNRAIDDIIVREVLSVREGNPPAEGPVPPAAALLMQEASDRGLETRDVEIYGGIGPSSQAIQLGDFHPQDALGAMVNRHDSTLAYVVERLKNEGSLPNDNNYLAVDVDQTGEIRVLRVNHAPDGRVETAIHRVGPEGNLHSGTYFDSVDLGLQNFIMMLRPMREGVRAPGMQYQEGIGLFEARNRLRLQEEQEAESALRYQRQMEMLQRELRDAVERGHASGVVNLAASLQAHEQPIPDDLRPAVEQMTMRAQMRTDLAEPGIVFNEVDEQPTLESSMMSTIWNDLSAQGAVWNPEGGQTLGGGHLQKTRASIAPQQFENVADYAQFERVNPETHEPEFIEPTDYDAQAIEAFRRMKRMQESDPRYAQDPEGWNTAYKHANLADMALIENFRIRAEVNKIIDSIQAAYGPEEAGRIVPGLMFYLAAAFPGIDLILGDIVNRYERGTSEQGPAQPQMV